MKKRLKIKLEQMKNEKQKEAPQNNNQMTPPQPQSFWNNQIPPYPYNNYYTMQFYHNPINDGRQYEKPNGYQNQNPYWNQNPSQMNPPYYTTPMPQQMHQNPYPMNSQNIPPY